MSSKNPAETTLTPIHSKHRRLDSDLGSIDDDKTPNGEYILNGQGLTPTESEKRANHIVSEQKRRRAIREGFERLTDIVPGLDSSHGRREAVVLKASVQYLEQLLHENAELRNRLETSEST